MAEHEITVSDGTATIKPSLPSLLIRMESGSMRFRPHKDMTAYELGRIMELLVCLMAPMAYVDVDGWWEQAGPDIWRHFEPET